jgi:cellulose synthase/poly-beta-1,6-N-acetylglucosamine synthase-like glycosyltransferase
VINVSSKLTLSRSVADRLGKKGVYGMGIFEANMYLAEDRILCFELAAKQNDRWVLSFVNLPRRDEFSYSLTPLGM